MSLFIGLLVLVALCALAVWLLPPPMYGSMRGCTGRALQAALEKKSEGRGTTEAACQDTRLTDRRLPH